MNIKGRFKRYSPLLLLGLLLGCVIYSGCRSPAYYRIENYVGYSSYSLRAIASYLLGGFSEEFPTQLPFKLKNGNYADPQNPDLINADPFGKKCASPQTVYVHWGRYDMMYKGCPFGYIRVAEKECILYSLGPDEDDDTAPAYALGRLNRVNPHTFLVPLRYDPTNGIASDGDITRYLKDGELLY